MAAGEINSKPQTITGKLREDRAPRPLLIAAEGTAHNPEAGEDALAQLAHEVRHAVQIARLSVPHWPVGTV
jgi:hypothetical protein